MASLATRVSRAASAAEHAAIPTATIVAHDVGTPGGMERQLGELCSGLIGRGYRVVVIARRCELPPHPRLRWIRVRAPRRPFSVAYPAFFLAGSLAVRRHRAGLLHTTGAVVCNRADVSTVHFCHHGFSAVVGVPQTARHSRGHLVNAAASAWMSRVAERFCFHRRRTRRLVAVSDGVARELERFLPDRRGEVAVIANGVDRDRFAPEPRARAEARDRLGLAENDLVALFVGGDWERKGLPFAIEGVARAGGWHLVVVGRGDEARHRALASRHGAGDRVHLVGGTSEPAGYYAAADAFLLPTAYEAFPLVSLEAAAAGLPLLAGRVSGVEELIDDGRNGWFVKRDAAEIAQRLRTLGADPVLRDHMGAAARERSARYTWERVVDAYVDLYATLAYASAAAQPTGSPWPS